jgi:hypothetical protein
MGKVEVTFLINGTDLSKLNQQNETEPVMGTGITNVWHDTLATQS